MVANLYPNGWSYPTNFEVLDGTLYFVANTPDGYRLFQHRTGEAPTPAIESALGLWDPRDHEVTAFGDALYFAEQSATGEGVELHSYSPAEGLRLVADIAPGATSSSPAHLRVHEGALYFSARAADGASWHLYRYTPADGVALAVESGGPSSPQQLTSLGDALYFSAGSLYRYTPGGGIERAAGDASLQPTALTAVGDALYFAAQDHLYRYTPADSASVAVADVFAAETPDQLGVFAEALYLSVGPGRVRRELHRYTPAEGLTRISDTKMTGSSYAQRPYVHEGELYFAADLDASGQPQLYRYSADHGARLVSDPASGPRLTYPGPYTSFNGALYMAAAVDRRMNVIRYAPEDAPTPLFPTDAGASPRSIQGVTVAGGELLFSGIVRDGSSDRRKLYRYAPGMAAPEPVTGMYQVGEDLAALDGSLYFTGKRIGYDYKLYQYTPGVGLAIVGDLNPGSDTFASELVASNGVLYFSAEGPEGRALWSYTPGGVPVSLTAQLDSSNDLFFPTELTPIGDALYFVGGSRASTGGGLYRYDDTAGSRRVVGLLPDPYGGTREILHADGETLYFTATTPELGRELYRLTAAGGVELVADIYPGPGDGIPRGLQTTFARYQGGLVFPAESPTAGAELHRLDARGVSTVAPPSGSGEVSLVWPNPTASRAAVRIAPRAPEAVRVTLYDALGRMVAVTFDGTLADEITLDLPTEGLAPGTYLVRVAGETITATRPLTIVR